MKPYFLRSSDLAYQLLFVAPALIVRLQVSLESPALILNNILGNHLAFETKSLNQTIAARPRLLALATRPAWC